MNIAAKKRGFSDSPWNDWMVDPAKGMA